MTDVGPHKRFVDVFDVTLSICLPLEDTTGFTLISLLFGGQNNMKLVFETFKLTY